MKISNNFVDKPIKALFAASALTMAMTSSAWAACTYTVTNNWGSGFTGEIKVTNDTTQTVNNWSVSWQESGVSLTNAWNATLSGSNPYTATSLNWNATLAPKASASFGFQAVGAAGTPKVNGSLCGTVASSAASSKSSSSVASSVKSSVASSVKSSVASSVKSSVASSVKSSVASSSKSSSSVVVSSSKSSSSAAVSSSSKSSSSSSSTSAPLLSQSGNPTLGFIDNYTKWLSSSGDATAKLTADKTRGNNIISWQMPHGGFYKNAVTVYDAVWDGKAERSGWQDSKGQDLGTIDNGATITELMFLADVYQRSGDTKYRDAARKTLDFLLSMPYASGGWPQVYPSAAVTSYSRYVTFNDDAMVRVLLTLDRVEKKTAPLSGELFTADQRTKAAAAITKGVDFILKSQIVQNKTKTVWCAQHDAVTYVPRGARSYELPSKSGKESVLIVGFLMTRPQTPEIAAAVKAAVAWYKSPAVKVDNKAYVSRPSGSTDNTYNPIQTKSGSTMWYRFYDLESDTGFFSGRLPTDSTPGLGKQYDIMAIEPERRYGYQWGGNYGTNVINYAESVGYF
jgi:PelA/Pel-15E family pectate lyase